MTIDHAKGISLDRAAGRTFIVLDSTEWQPENQAAMPNQWASLFVRFKGEDGVYKIDTRIHTMINQLRDLKEAGRYPVEASVSGARPNFELKVASA